MTRPGDALVAWGACPKCKGEQTRGVGVVGQWMKWSCDACFHTWEVHGVPLSSDAAVELTPLNAEIEAALHHLQADGAIDRGGLAEVLRKCRQARTAGFAEAKEKAVKVAEEVGHRSAGKAMAACSIAAGRYVEEATEHIATALRAIEEGK